MNILVRLPNWLGDMVMSTAFIKALQKTYPHASIDVIAKKNLADLLHYFPSIKKHWLFDKKEWKGISGAYQFGKMIQSVQKYDLFFCLPDSFSSAIMGFGTGAKKRIGYKKELRNFLLTQKFTKPKGLHRVDEYVRLLELFTGTEIKEKQVELSSTVAKIANRIIINFNSEASSRRMPVAKAVSIMHTLLQQFHHHEFVFIGTPAEKEHVDSIVKQLPASSNQLINKAGATTLKELFELIASASLMLSTDSGPAHVANAFTTKTVVLFGAGNEENTAPYNASAVTVIRNGTLPCEPCVSNTCKFGEPKCLLLLNNETIAQAVVNLNK